MNLFIKLAQISKPTNIPTIDNPGDAQIQTILNIVFVTIGAISVLIIAIAGFSYVLSQGDSQRTARAKDAILYAIIGVVVSLSAVVIINFVIARIFA